MSGKIRVSKALLENVICQFAQGQVDLRIGVNDFCTMEMRLKNRGAFAEHDFRLRGSLECLVQWRAHQSFWAN